ncbi:MAG: TetR/AcrR family transcriptional regulator [Candidatus Binatia bacterium]|nr:TetR/AcrR family transcriptional regulator [Candidatus Binatia bacterium]
MPARLSPTALEEEAFLRWVRPPRQGRTREQLGRILEAAEGLISRRGFDDTSVVEIARVAGTSVGGFYRRFPTKGALLHALHERFCAEAKETASSVLDPARWQGVPTLSVFQALVDFLIGIYNERRGLFRAFIVRAITDPTTNKRNRELFEFLAEKMSALLTERRKDIDHPDPTLGARFVLRMMFGTLNHFLVVADEWNSFTEKTLRQELARAFRAYLGVRPPYVAQRRRA